MPVTTEPFATAAEDHFRRALDWARRQGTLSWELRAAMSLARLLGNQDRSAEGQAILRPVYERDSTQRISDRQKRFLRCLGKPAPRRLGTLSPDGRLSE